MDLTGWSRATLYRKIDSADLQVKFGEPGASGGSPPKLILLSSLGRADQARWWVQQAKAEREGSAKPVSQDVASDESKSEPETNDSKTLNLAEIADGCRDEALRRLPIVLEGIRIMETQSDVTRRIRVLAKREKVNASTLYSWVKAYSKSGIEGLVPHWGKKLGTWTALPLDLQKVVRDFWCSPLYPSVSRVVKFLAQHCQERQVKMPSETTLRRYLSTLPERVVIPQSQLGLWVRSDPRSVPQGVPATL